MKKAKHIKVVVDDKQQAEGILAELAAIDRKLAEIENKMNEEVDAAKATAAQAKAPLEKRAKELNDAVKKWATMNKSALFENRKSIDLGFGVIGFRASTTIQQIANVSAEETLAKLQQFGFTEGIRMTPAINKDGMTLWPDERLALVGLVRKEKDKYFCEIAKEKLSSCS